MKIAFERLIKESGEKLTKKRLASEMAEKGLFKSLRSAENTIQLHLRGKPKSCNWELLKYLCERFDRKGNEVIDWDE